MDRHLPYYSKKCYGVRKIYFEFRRRPNERIRRNRFVFKLTITLELPFRHYRVLGPGMPPFTLLLPPTSIFSQVLFLTHGIFLLLHRQWASCFRLSRPHDRKICQRGPQEALFLSRRRRGKGKEQPVFP